MNNKCTSCNCSSPEEIPAMNIVEVDNWWPDYSYIVDMLHDEMEESEGHHWIKTSIDYGAYWHPVSREFWELAEVGDLVVFLGDQILLAQTL